MSNYTKQISWSGKDALSDSDSEKVISGGDFDTEFSAVQTAINSKIDGGTITNFTSTGIDDNATSTAITIDSAEHVSLAHGIGFNGDTAAANALDDYEEGTWTPAYSTATGAFGSITYVGATPGRYTKIGNLVTLFGYIGTDGITIGTAAGAVYITGLPFANESVGAGNFQTGVTGDRWGGENPQKIETRSGESFLRLFYHATVTSDEVATDAADLSTAGGGRNYMRFQLSYRTTA